MWDASQKTSANWGGSTLAVLKSSKNPAAATEFARWLLQEKQPVEMFCYERFLFPTLNSMLTNPKWLNKKYPFYGGQQVNKVYADMAGLVDKTWQWPPIFEYVATTGRRHQGQVRRPGQGRHVGAATLAGCRRQLRQAAGPDRRRPVSASERARRARGGPAPPRS